MARYTKIGATIGGIFIAGAIISLLIVVVAPAVLGSLYAAPPTPSGPSSSVSGAVANLQNSVQSLLPIIAMLLIVLSPVAVVIGVLADVATGGFKEQGTAAGAAGDTTQNVSYAGFWLRFVAYIIDYIIVSIITVPFAFVAGLVVGLVAIFGAGSTNSSSFDLIARLVGIVISILVTWIYYAFCESSPWQATPGKKALGVIVTDYDGKRISFKQATIRYFAKILSALIFGIGYLMIGFTPKKQGLHDEIAKTLVVRGKPSSESPAQVIAPKKK